MTLRNISLALALFASGTIAAQQRILITSPLPIDTKAEAVAEISGSELRLQYVQAGEGGRALACTMAAKADGKWLNFIGPMEDNKVFVITGPQKHKRPGYKSYYPSWTSGDSVSTNPYLSGSVCEAVPVKARNIDRNSIEVEYVTAGDHIVRGVWTLAKDARSATLQLYFTPAKDGCYSLGVMAAHAALPSSVTNVQLPPMYQYRRIQPQPHMLLSAMMPTPVAMVEAETAGRRMTAFVSADNTLAPLDWGGVDHSPIGFTIKNHDNHVEPVAFSPVLGMADSKMKAGLTVCRRFEVGLAATPWNETLEHVAKNIYKVRDYRRQADKSLTETMYSIIELMRDDEHGGWDKAMRGYYDIEGKPTKAPTVVHSAPLAIVAAAINSGDEEFYMSRALPTIEYTLSRKGYRWSTKTTDDGYNKDPETLRLSPFGSQFTTTYYEGLYRLLGARNEWLRDIALPEGELRAPRGYSAPILSWVQALAAYRLTGDEKWLRRARSTAERDAKMHIYTNSEKPMRYQAFYNSTIYHPWWEFLDLYEVTGDRQFLEAARYGAAMTMAGIRSWPAVNDSVQTIHHGGVYNGNATMWWKGSEQFRLGFPRVEGDAPEHDVEQWRVSPVGLGFEQPSTYFLRNKGKLVRPVFMSSWAPDFLRLNIHTGDELFDTYARNAVIGRFTNYPGYYATGYTDLTMKEDFPYTGPDVSSIYYHHIPPHLAFTADYLISEAIQRSGGKVNFPFGKQEGFVWFANRVFGGEAGTVFDDRKAMLWLRKGIITSDNPEVNYITAVSDSRLWVLLCNESREAVSTVMTAGTDAVTIANTAAASVWNAKGKSRKIECYDNKYTVELQPKGFTAISIPLKADAAASSPELQAILRADRTPALKEGWKVVESGTEAGKIYTFRIRSPFGWDSVYGFCETPPCEGVNVEVSCGDESDTIGVYPYEWSFARFAPSDKVKLSVKVSDSKGNQKTHLIEI